MIDVKWESSGLPYRSTFPQLVLIAPCVVPRQSSAAVLRDPWRLVANAALRCARGIETRTDLQKLTPIARVSPEYVMKYCCRAMCISAIRTRCDLTSDWDHVLCAQHGPAPASRGFFLDAPPPATQEPYRHRIIIAVLYISSLRSSCVALPDSYTQVRSVPIYRNNLIHRHFEGD